MRRLEALSDVVKEDLARGLVEWIARLESLPRPPADRAPQTAQQLQYLKDEADEWRERADRGECHHAGCECDGGFCDGFGECRCEECEEEDE